MLSKLLRPNSIAVIGASRNAKKVGGAIFHNLAQSHYHGRVYPVNINARKILGHDVYDSVLDVPERVDLAVIAIPAQFVNAALEDCGQKGIKNVVVVSAGFEEIASGQKLSQELRAIAARYQLNVVGPNCLGFINTGLDINASFARSIKSKGKIAMISQSGAMGTAFLDWSEQNSTGLHYFVSLGNKSLLNENDFLREFVADDDVSLITLYLEDFADGREFVSIATSTDKPIVLLKAGRTDAAKQASASHTGAIAGDERLIAAACERAGVLLVDTMEDMFIVSKLFDEYEHFGSRVAVVTNAGGVGIQAVDDLAHNGLLVPSLSDTLHHKLSKILPANAGLHNPIDILGDASADLYARTLDVLLASSEIDAILTLLTPQLMTEALKSAEVVSARARRSGKILVTSFIGGSAVAGASKYLLSHDIAQFAFPNDAARTLGLVARWQRMQNGKSEIKGQKTPLVIPALPSSGQAPAGIFRKTPAFAGVTSNKNSADMMRANLAYELLKKYEIPTLPSDLFDDAELLYRHKVDYPCVLKIAHPSMVHKSESGSVVLDIGNEMELRSAVQRLGKIARAQRLRDFQFELQPYIIDKMEVILGVLRDGESYRDLAGEKVLKSRGFGHFLLFGAGGIYAEVLSDTAFAMLPIRKSQIRELILATKMGKILSGARGKKYDFEGVVDVIASLSKLVKARPQITSLDINPLFITRDHVYAVDVKVFS